MPRWSSPRAPATGVPGDPPAVALRLRDDAVVALPVRRRRAGDRRALRRHEALCRPRVRPAPGGRHRRSANGSATGSAPGEPGGGNAPEDQRVEARPTCTRCSPPWPGWPASSARAADAEEFADPRRRHEGCVQRRLPRRRPGYRGAGQDGNRYRQMHNVLALAFGIIPDAATTGRGRRPTWPPTSSQRGYHLDTGALGTKCLLPVLTRHGYADVAVQARRADDVPQLGLQARPTGPPRCGSTGRSSRAPGPLLPRHRGRLVLPVRRRHPPVRRQGLPHR